MQETAAMMRRRFRGSASSLAEAAAGAEPNGVWFYFSDASMVVRDVATPANNYSSKGIAANGALVGPGGKLTYGAPSAKMCRQSDGKVRYGAHNLLTYSEDFSNAIWTQETSGGAVPIVTPNFATAPDGTLTATRLQLDKTGGAWSRIIQGGGLFASGVIGASYAFSIWMRTVSGTANVGLRVGAETPGEVFAVNETWTKLTRQVTTGSVNITPQIMLWDSMIGSDETADILIAEAHLRRTPSNDDYIATGAAPLYALPYHDAGDGNGPLPLFEPQSTNLFTSSQDTIGLFTAGISTAFSANVALDASGEMRADRALRTNLTSYGGAVLNKAASALKYCVSVVVQREVGDYFVLMFQSVGSANRARVTFNLATGTISQPASNVGAITGAVAGIIPLGDGRYRAWLSATSDAQVSLTTYFCAASSNLVAIDSADTEAVASVLLSDWQIENGEYPSSIIRTYGTAGTRAADVVSLASGLFPVNPAEITLFAELEPLAAPANIWPGYAYLQSADGNNSARIGANPSLQGKLVAVSASVAVADLSATGVLTLGAMNRMAARFVANDMAFSLNGAAVTTDTDAAMPLNISSLTLAGGALAASVPLRLKRLTFIPRQVSNGDLPTFGGTP